jgi:hypothetical protein
MGVDCRVWVIPQHKAFRPTAEQVGNLANALRNDGWVPKPEADGQNSKVIELLPGKYIAGTRPSRAQDFSVEPFTPSWVEFHSEHELVLEWHVQDMKAAGVQYPFVFDPYPDSGPPYFYVRLILGHEYFYWIGENVMPFGQEATRCVCGEQLVYRAGWAHGTGSDRIHRNCPRCDQIFDPSGLTCEVLDGWTGEAAPLIGGLTFRFALSIDCHKYFPREEEAGRRFHLRPDFLDLWRTHIGVSFSQVVTFD